MSNRNQASFLNGTLEFNDNTGRWSIRMSDGRTLDVRPGRIDDLNRVGTYLQVGQIVQFTLENTEQFPYQWAVPVATSTDPDNLPLPTATIAKKIKKQYKFHLLLSGFSEDEMEIVCDHYDSSSSGSYYYFYNDNNNGPRQYLGFFPIERTVIYKIEKVETEY